MATVDQKVSALTALTGANVADDDEFLITDTSATESKRITAAEFLQLFGKQYTQSDGDFTVTGTNWTTDRATAIYYRTINNSHRLKFNIHGKLSSPAAAVTLTISGVTFINSSDFHQAVAAYLKENGVAFREKQYSYVATNTGTIELGSGSNFDWIGVSGDVELESKPTWAD